MMCLAMALFSLVALAISLLTVKRVSTLWGWKTALAAQEYGHGLALGTLLLGLAAISEAASDGHTNRERGLCLVAAGMALGGSGFFFRPFFSARRLARGLPAQLAAAFGPQTLDRAPLRFSTLYWSSRPARAPMETRRVVGGDGTPLAMDLYRANTPAPAPCVIIVHGGGWDGGDRKQLPAVNHWLAERGFTVAAVSYRLAPASAWPAPADDVVAAIAYLKTHATELGIDPTRFILLGRSAGGQIATAVAYGRSETAVRGVVSLYGPQDLMYAWEHSREGDVLNPLLLMRQYLGGTPETAGDVFRDASPYLRAAPGLPPTLLLHGAMDTLVWHRQSERLHTQLNVAGVPNAFVSLPWATHAFDVNLNGPAGQLTTYALEWFLRSVTAERRNCLGKADGIWDA